MKDKEDRRVRKTRKLLKNALVERLQTAELTNISVKELCSDADINRSTFYLHYSNVFDLRNSIENEIIDTMTEILAGFKAEVILTDPLPLLLEVTSYMESENQIIRKLFKTREAFALMEKIKDCFTGYFLENCRDIIPRGHIADLDLYISFVVSGSVSLFYKWFLGEIDISMNHLAHVIEKLITGGVEEYLDGIIR